MAMAVVAGAAYRAVEEVWGDTENLEAFLGAERLRGSSDLEALKQAIREMECAATWPVDLDRVDAAGTMAELDRLFR